MPFSPAFPVPKAAILDIGGVVLADPMSDLFDAMSGGDPQRREAVTARHAQLRAGLWSGRLPEAEYWEELRPLSVLGSPDNWRGLLDDAMAPLPAAGRLEEISSRVPLAAVSNHRSEWLAWPLQRHGLHLHFTAVHVSDVTGLVKPGAAPVLHAAAALGFKPEEIVFVDDKPANLTPAAAAGFLTLRADSAGAWAGTLLDVLS